MADDLAIFLSTSNEARSLTRKDWDRTYSAIIEPRPPEPVVVSPSTYRVFEARGWLRDGRVDLERMWGDLRREAMFGPEESS